MRETYKLTHFKQHALVLVCLSPLSRLPSPIMYYYIDHMHTQTYIKYVGLDPAGGSQLDDLPSSDLFSTLLY